MTGKISFTTLGCRVNQYESSVLANSLAELGFEIVPFGDGCDICIVNTCTVTAESDRKSRQLVRRAAKKTSVGVIVTGCFAEVSHDDAKKIDGVICVIGNKNKSEVVNAVKYHMGLSITPPIESADSFEKCTRMLTTPGRVRSFIKIEDGCTSKCAYCIIPKARGPIRSKNPAVILKEADELIGKGSPEIILTGIEISAYGMDLKKDGVTYDLANLIHDLSKNPRLERLGLGSLDPTLMTETFLQKIASSEKLLRHFHISLQSGCSSVLKRMRRKYNAEQALVIMERIRKYFPDANISADVIVGFPGESEEEFSKTVNFCRKADFLNLHIFPYSMREGTEAAEMPDQISENEKKRRVAILESIHAETRSALMKKYSRRTDPVNILFEQKKNGVLIGHSEHYVELKVDGPSSLIGKICKVMPNEDGSDTLV